MNVIVDTCVIVDFLQQREGFQEDATTLCFLVAKGTVAGFLTAKSITDIYYLMHRSLHSDTKTRQLLKNLLLSYGILDTTATDCRNAITSPMGDFEDAVLAETAYRTGVDYIVTRNVRDYDRAIVPVITPHDFVQMVMNAEPINDDGI